MRVVRVDLSERQARLLKAILKKERERNPQDEGIAWLYDLVAISEGAVGWV